MALPARNELQDLASAEVEAVSLVTPFHGMMTAGSDGSITGSTSRGITTIDPLDPAFYGAGNHPGISDAYLPTPDPRALGRRTLQRFARQTALERASALGISESLVSEER
jgi:hypothetical protein